MAMSPYEHRPWLALYRHGQPHEVAPEFANCVEMFADSVRRAPTQDAICYFDRTINVAELDELSDALAAGLQELGFTEGDRLALYCQNDPAFVIGMLGAWKLGGVPVAVNPMYKERELTHVLRDSGARAVLYLDELGSVVDAVRANGVTVDLLISYAARDFQRRNDARALGEPVASTMGLSLTGLLHQYRGNFPSCSSTIEPDDEAFLVYTSGTTGEPKGAQLTHANFVVNARNYREWMELDAGDPILAVAPLFHITGLVGHAVLSLLLPGPLVLGHRFHPEVMMDLIKEHRPVFTVGAITAFASLAAVPGVGPDDFSSLTKVYSGGAPIAPAVADRIETMMGTYVHNAYGLTETSSITHIVPPDRQAPVDPDSGALSIGTPIASVHARIVDDASQDLPVGEVGELVISGPQLAKGYWGREDAWQSACPEGEFYTGDVGFMDTEGWFYLVDRKKDLIIASGYKVWPREVEDVLYTHPAVREAAVVGMPDEYRGETVAAFVSLRPGEQATESELVDFCRARMAAYKYPRSLSFVDELPKTASGKILRRTLRDPPNERQVEGAQTQ